ncbi:MAG: SDR family NAD(P)-dependent oxidoreductase [Candidatus Wenzhouxiangella sp. M2_3B_020]
MDRYVITGGNRGLGFELARHIADVPDTEVVLAVRDPERGRKAAEEIGDNASVMELDLTSRESVDRFVAAWEGPLSGLVNNAGTQIADDTRFTEAGIEETFAVNHLHALKLTLSLVDELRGGRVMFIGSGTHNPRHPTATKFGFRGEQYESIDQCAKGLDSAESVDQLGKDRYATTKFLNMATTVELARRFEPEDLLVLCLDPGLMPGTDLARSAPAVLRFGWHYVLPIVARVLPDSSTPKRSGEAGAWLMTSPRDDLHHGGIYSYDRRLNRYVEDRVRDPEIGKQLVDDSMELIRRETESG